MLSRRPAPAEKQSSGRNIENSDLGPILAPIADQKGADRSWLPSLEVMMTMLFAKTSLSVQDQIVQSGMLNQRHIEVLWIGVAFFPEEP